MAGAVQSMVASGHGDIMTGFSVQYILDRLYTNRISIHLLISMYQAVHKRDPALIARTVNSECDVMQVAREAFEDAAFMCEREYQEHPELEIIGRDTTDKGASVDKVCISYVPAHLHHIFFEVSKNGMKATAETVRKRAAVEELPPIKSLGMDLCLKW